MYDTARKLVILQGIWHSIDYSVFRDFLSQFFCMAPPSTHTYTHEKRPDTSLVRSNGDTVSSVHGRGDAGDSGDVVVVDAGHIDDHHSGISDCVEDVN